MGLPLARMQLLGETSDSSGFFYSLNQRMAWTKAAHTFRHECDIQRTPQKSLFEGGHQRNTIRSPAVSPAIPIPINNHDQTHPKNIKKRDSFSEMNDPTRYFSKERDLAKRCNRRNRTSRTNIGIYICIFFSIFYCARLCVCT